MMQVMHTDASILGSWDIQIHIQATKKRTKK